MILELQDDFTAKAARAAAAAKLLSGAVDDMGSHSRSSSKDMDEAERSTSAFAKTAGNSTTSIDRYSGRLGLLAEAAITLGPALIPLGASTIPVLTASLAGLGAAAGGIGAAILAFHGLSEGIKALDAYNLAPTVQNLDKLRVAEEKLGPAGVQFLHYIDALEPQLRALQQTARAGMFPGVEQGLNDLLQRLPLVRGVVKSLSTEMGTLAAEAGHSLSSSSWKPFFQYVRAEAAPTLDAFAHSAGNVALGLANLFVAFGPVNRGFTSGLEELTARFADWSKNLDSNKGFQDFLGTIQQSGPQAIAFLGALIRAMVGLLKAAQPWGSVVLPILTDALKVFSAIANSPIGPALYGAAAAMIVYSRGVKVAEAAQKDFASSFAKIPEILAVVAVVEAVTTLKNANDQLTTSIKESQAALRSNDQGQIQQDLAKTNDELQKIHDTTSNVDWFGAPSWDKAKQIIPLVSAELAKANGTAARLKFTQGELQTSMQEGGGIADLFGAAIGQTGRQMATAANDAGQLDRALSHLNGWFSRRDAVLAYKDSIDALAKGLKNGFTRDDAKNLDSMGEAILQVANQIRNPAHRADFLQTARGELEDLAHNAGPKARKAIQDVISAFDNKGLTHPKPITPTVDTKPAQRSIAQVTHGFDIMTAMSGGPTITADGGAATRTIDGVTGLMTSLARQKVSPHISVDPGNSFSILGGIKAEIASIRDKTVTIRTVHSGGPGPQAASGSAEGSTVPKDRLPYADRYLYLLAPGEEVISNRFGQADRHRPLLKAINAGRMASGGTSGGHGRDWGFSASGSGSSPDAGSHAWGFVPLGPLQHLGDNLTSVAAALGLWKDALARSKKELDKEKQARSDAVQAYQSAQSGISGQLMTDPFSLSSASSNSWSSGASGGVFNPTGNLAATAATASGFIANIKTLQTAGLSQAALNAIIAEGPDVVARMAQFSQSQLSAYNAQYATTSALVAQASQYGAQAEGLQPTGYGKDIRGIRSDIKALNATIKQLTKENNKGHAKTANAAANAGTKASAHANHRSRGHH